jgi:hypothetical protein
VGEIPEDLRDQINRLPGDAWVGLGKAIFELEDMEGLRRSLVLRGWLDRPQLWFVGYFLGIGLKLGLGVVVLRGAMRQGEQWKFGAKALGFNSLNLLRKLHEFLRR